MARIRPRFVIALLCAAWLTGLTSCRRPAAGDACTQNGKFVCTSHTGGLICQSGTLQTLPCRGPRGCQGAGAASQCDDDLAQPGDACQQTVNENDSCSTDRAEQLLCKDGKFAVARTCKGPAKCTVTGDVIGCDDSVADVGDPCIVEPGEANYACSTDKKIELACDAATARFQASNSCRGPKGCWMDANLPHCDNTVGREGDVCRPFDNRVCSEDGKAELKCSQQGKLVRVRDCKHACSVRSGRIECD